jgi:hypothetical protein
VAACVCGSSLSRDSVGVLGEGVKLSRCLRRVCCILLLLGASTASAQGSKDLIYGRDGFALGLGGFAGISPSGRSVSERDDVELSNGGGINFDFEYRFHQLASVDLLVETLERDVQSALDPDETFQNWTVSLNGRIYLSPGRFQPFLLAGFGFATGSQTTLIPGSDTIEAALRVGGGGDFYFTDHFVLGFSIEKPFFFGSLSDLDYLKIGAGLKYRF